MPSHTLKTLGDKVIRLYSAMIGRLSMLAILDATYKRFVISSQFCMSINFVPFLVAFWLAISHQAYFFAYDFVEYLLSTEQFYPTHNILQSSASANKPLCHTFCYPALYHCCSSISSQGVHSPLKKVFCHGEMCLP